MYFDFSSTKIPIDDKNKDRNIIINDGGQTDGLLSNRGDLTHQQQNDRNSNPDPFQLHPPLPPLNQSKHRRLNARWRDSGQHLLNDEGRRWEASDAGGGGVSRRKMRQGPGEDLDPLRRRRRWRKNAVMVLKETIPHIEYSLVRATGPCHCPTFTVQTVINGQTYMGCGRTKRKARMQAATRAILSSIQFPDSCVTHDVIQPYLPRSIDFTSDSFHGWSTSDEPEVPDPLERSDDMTSSKVNHRVPDLTEVPWNPVSILNDIRPQSKYRRVQPPPGGASSGADRKCIRISVTFDGMTFDGVGRCQRSAKQRAAQAALKDYFNLRFIGSIRPPHKSPSSSFSNTQVTA